MTDNNPELNRQLIEAQQMLLEAQKAHSRAHLHSQKLTRLMLMLVAVLLGINIALSAWPLIKPPAPYHSFILPEPTTKQPTTKQCPRLKGHTA